MFHFKDNDSSFIIHGISAAIWFSEEGIRNLDDCLNERKKGTGLKDFAFIKLIEYVSLN